MDRRVVVVVVLLGGGLTACRGVRVLIEAVLRSSRQSAEEVARRSAEVARRSADEAAETGRGEAKHLANDLSFGSDANPRGVDLNLTDRPPWLEDVVSSVELRQWLDEPFKNACVATAFETMLKTILVSATNMPGAQDPKNPLQAGIKGALEALPDAIRKGVPMGALVVIRKAAFESAYQKIVLDPVARDEDSIDDLRNSRQIAVKIVTRVGAKMAAKNPMLACELGLSEAVGKFVEESTKSLIGELGEYTINAHRSSL